MKNYEWSWFKAGRMTQVALRNGEDAESYRRRIMREVAGVNTVFGLTAEGVDRCLERFAADAGDWRAAGDDAKAPSAAGPTSS